VADLRRLAEIRQANGLASTLNIADHSTTAAIPEIAAAALKNHEDFVDNRAAARWETLVAAFPATHRVPARRR
jgi:hypothetical protein